VSRKGKSSFRSWHAGDRQLGGRVQRRMQTLTRDPPARKQPYKALVENDRARIWPRPKGPHGTRLA
jgi:hypothetical protein